HELSPPAPRIRHPPPHATRNTHRTSRFTFHALRPYISTWNIPPVFHEPCLQGNSSRKQDPAVANFYSAAAHRSRGALWPSFAPARIFDIPLYATCAENASSKWTIKMTESLLPAGA